MRNISNSSPFSTMDYEGLAEKAKAFDLEDFNLYVEHIDVDKIILKEHFKGGSFFVTYLIFTLILLCLTAVAFSYFSAHPGFISGGFLLLSVVPPVFCVYDCISRDSKERLKNYEFNRSTGTLRYPVGLFRVKYVECSFSDCHFRLLGEMVQLHSGGPRNVVVTLDSTQCSTNNIYGKPIHDVVLYFTDKNKTPLCSLEKSIMDYLPAFFYLYMNKNMPLPPQAMFDLYRKENNKRIKDRIQQGEN